MIEKAELEELIGDTFWVILGAGRKFWVSEETALAVISDLGTACAEEKEYILDFKELTGARVVISTACCYGVHELNQKVICLDEAITRKITEWEEEVYPNLDEKPWESE